MSTFHIAEEHLLNCPKIPEAICHKLVMLAELAKKSKRKKRCIEVLVRCCWTSWSAGK